MQPSARGPALTRRAISTALRLLLTAALLGALASRIDLDAARVHLARAPAWSWLLPTPLYCLGAFLHGARVQVLMRALGPAPGLLRTWGLMLRAAALGTFLPPGGAEVAKAGLLATEPGRPEAAAVAAILVARLIELVPWTALLVWGLVWGLQAHDPLVGGGALLFALGFLGLILVAAVLLRLPEAPASSGPDRPAPDSAAARLWRLLDRLPGALRARLLALRTALRALARAPRALLLSLLLSLPFAAINVLTAWLALRAQGFHLRYTDAAAIIPALDAMLSLPLSLGGVGLREGLMVGLLAPFGGDAAAAVAAAWTRWTGELGRAAIGGLLLLRAPPSPPPEVGAGP